MNDNITGITIMICVISSATYFYICIREINKRLTEFKSIHKRLYLIENPYKYQLGDIVQFKYPYIETPEMTGIITNRRITGEEGFGKLYAIFVEKEKDTHMVSENYIIGLAK